LTRTHRRTKGIGPEGVEGLVGEFLAGLRDQSIAPSRDAEAMLSSRIARIDQLLSAQVTEILHHPAFQELEAAWRSLSGGRPRATR
jgi:type VI secretion system protein ImpC